MKQLSDLLLLLVFTGAMRLTAANWPEWRGPTGNHVTPERNLVVEWSETKNIRWKIALPDRGNSSPIVWGDRVFVTQAVSADNRRAVMCIDRATGRLLWQQGTVYREKEETHEENPYCAASPVTDGRLVMATFGSAGVYCYDYSGKEIWKRDLGPQKHIWGNAASPVLHGNLCIVYHGPGPNSVLVALNKETGATVWEQRLPEPVPTKRTDGFAGQAPGIVGTFGTPGLIRAGGRDELILSLPDEIKALDPATGKPRWNCSGLSPLVYASPIFGEGVVVAMGGYFGSTVAVRPGGDGDVTKTHLVWREERAKKNRLGSGVILNGHIYVLNQDGIAECLELKTGRSVWTERLKGPGARTDSWSSLVLSGDRCYAVNQSGDVFVFRAGPVFDLLATNSVGEPTNSSLAVSDGEIFLRTHRSLWCIGGPRRVASVQ